MTWKAHTLQAAVATAAAQSYFTAAESAVFFLSVIFIDIDHYFDFVVVTGRFGIREMFKYHRWIWERRDEVYGISVLHTAEVFAALYFLGYLSRFFTVIFYGFLIHMAFDLIHSYRHRVFFNRAFSIIEYLIKRRTCPRGYLVPDKGFWE